MDKFEPREVTISEAADVWGKNRQTIKRFIDDYRAEWRHSGKIILISVRSLRRKFGEPIRAFHQ